MSSNIKRAVVVFVLSASTMLGFTGTSSASTTPGINAANYARDHLLGKPYVYGATGPNAYDCSSMVQNAFHSGGNRDIPRTTGDQWRYLRSKGTATTTHIHTAQKGDILFFWKHYWKNGVKHQYVVHVGIYYKDGKMIDANAGSQDKVVIESAFYNWGFDYITHGWVK